MTLPAPGTSMVHGTVEDAVRTLETVTSTGSGLFFDTEKVQDAVAAMIVAGTNITKSYDDTAGTLTINSTASGGGGTGNSTMATEADAGIAVGNSGATNRANANAWSAANVGAPIFIRKGIYDFAGTWNPKGPVFGAGPGVTVLRFPEQSTSNLYFIGVSNITVADFEVRSTSTATPFAMGVNTGSSNHITMDHVTVFHERNLYLNGAANIGIMHLGCKRGSTQGVRVQGTVRDGLHYKDNCEDISVNGNQVWNTGDDCIAVVSYDGETQNKRISVTGNVVSNIRARGITIEGGLDITVVGNTVGPVASNGILLNTINSTSPDTQQQRNITCVGNTIHDAAGDGIHCNGDTGTMLVAHNVIRSPAGQGIIVLRGRVVLDGNIIDDPGATGIYMSQNPSFMHESVIRNNTIRRPNSMGIYVQVAVNKLTVANNTIQEPASIASSAPGIQLEGGAQQFVFGNRIDGISTTKTPTAIVLFNISGALVSNNVGTLVGGMYAGTGTTTGVTTANNVAL